MSRGMRFIWVLAVAVCAITVGAARATTVNVLWYDNAGASYESAMNTLAASAPGYAPGSGLSWNLTFWQAGNAAPTLSGYNVLVIQSNELGTGNFTSVFNAKAAITAARGDRTFLTGQDADYHYMFGPGAVNNGPKGFLIDAVNWAASGTGLGIVVLNPTSSGLASNSNSFLFSELSGKTTGVGGNDVNIPGAYASFPINAGLTSAGLSNWNSSYHTTFSGVTGYTAINVNNAGAAVTIVSTDSAGSSTTPVPLPSAASMGGAVLLLGCVGQSLRKGLTAKLT